MNTLYHIIEQAIRLHVSSVEVSYSTIESDVYMAIRQVMRDNPDIFWFSHQWSFREITDENGHKKHIVNFRYPIDKERCEKIKAQIDDVVQNDFKLAFAHTLSINEQVMYVYTWVALYCNYTIHSAHNQTIYSVFVHRHSVCTGIAKATQYLLKLLGIDSRLVFGKMNNSDKDSRHCWLIVYIEGQWYHLDPTFALPETEHLLHQCGVTPVKGDDLLFYNFFCVDTETIKQSRTIEEEDLLPTCISQIDYSILQQIMVTPSRNGNSSGLGCVLSKVGTTADIYLAHDEDKYNRRRFVAKVFRDDENHELLRKELIVMRECAGPHLLRAGGADFSNGILYMEQATPLSELLASHYYKLTLKGFCNLLIDIASGLKELQDHGILYRDIHLNNIYLYEDPLWGKLTYKLGDFGSCTFVNKDGKYAGLTDRGGVGSKWYMAPETWNEGIFDERSAVYGIGMIAYYLLNDLYPPFWQEYGEESLDKRMQSHRLPTPSKLQEDGFCNLRMDFIFKSLSYNSSERYQALSELIEAINECKGRNPNKLIVEVNGLLHSVREQTIAEKSKFLEEQDWLRAISSQKINLLKEYLKKYPQGTYRNEARQLIYTLKQKLEEDEFWEHAMSSKKIEFLMMYIEKYPNGLHCNEARSRIYSVHQSRKQKIDDFATTCAPCLDNQGVENDQRNLSDTFFPNTSKKDSIPLKNCSSPDSSKSPVGLFAKLKKMLLGKHEDNAPIIPKDHNIYAEKTNSSIFAPSETKKGDYMMVQVFLYKDDEERTVACKAAEVDPDARRQNYTPLSVKLKDGDRVKAKLTMSGKGIEVDEPFQEMIWQGHYTDCQFGVYVPEEYKPTSMMGTVMLTVNDIPCGRMMFKTKIVSQPQKLYAKIESKAFQKIFISYSHKDEATVKYFAKAFQAQGVDYFFDRHYLKAGDVYPLKIKEYINSADLFILCWSKNAAESEYVQLERQQALALAFPQKDMEQATLSIHPISIEPHADYPSDMKEVYNFEEI